ncbi:hypothetical protein [Halorubrum vacuolatum]|uniref:Uncharacterized protein n=1 Tax=Halorubrum vacuolatum TaxID=63740 RepID=A0A238UTL8_HALVU|nr:hypothetical protein [Halorubrum vacuolatum]SNR25505.1 hypothetical protein SAMN06264855_101371 [Halorubrum vacuolatum]
MTPLLLAVGPPALVLAALTLAAAAVTYVMFQLTREEHESREYAWTWAIAIGILFLMGIGPALVGIGLYLTIERGYPLYWLLALAAVGIIVAGVLAIFGMAVYVEETVVGNPSLTCLSVAWAGTQARADGRENALDR